LQQALIELPVAAWPYGRVVAVQEISIRNGDGSDDRPIAHNLEAALAILHFAGHRRAVAELTFTTVC
jgi:hypothetical protein